MMTSSSTFRASSFVMSNFGTLEPRFMAFERRCAADAHGPRAQPAPLAQPARAA